MSNSLPEKLLAKSKRKSRLNPNNEITVSLQEHSVDTARCAEFIFRLDKRWGRNWCRFFGIRKEDRTRFLLNLKIAALFHDIGKANEDFYRAVTSTTFSPQSVRHEHLSALILFLPQVRSWLAQNPALDLDVITAAVLSHHLKAFHKSEPENYGWCAPRGRQVIPLFLQHPEVGQIFEKVKEAAGLGEQPNLPSTTWGGHSPYQEAKDTGLKAANAFRRQVAKDKNRLSFLLAIKAGVMVADAASSGLVREEHSIEAWINDVAHKEEQLTASALAEAILHPRTRQIAERTKKPFVYEDFQTRIAEQGSRVLLLAACGAGKTLAAWKWAEAQTSQYEIGKVIFLYPTRGTATEGFRDYVGWAPEAEAALDHGTSAYELEAMQENPSESLKGKTHELSEAEERLYALGLWKRKYFSATVDQFLGFMEHQYNSFCKLPMLADCALIIDEVHSFDPKMFGTLVSFLKHFDLPVLCMTATLPPHRQRELEAAGLKLYRAAEDARLKEQEENLRYRLQPVADEEAAFQRAIEAYEEGKRVLWVVNTVKRCQRIADRLVLELVRKKIGEKQEISCQQVADCLAKELGIEVLSYHSRFKLEDRKNTHQKTIAAFQQEGKAAIAVTTQVCEMSLDLDAEVLLTEHAPVPSLVQRFGRANRHLKYLFAILHTYAPEDNKPYFKEELEIAKTFLVEIGEREVSQAELASLLEKHALEEPASDNSAKFLESGYFATPGKFRDADEFALPCVLDSDLSLLEAKINAKMPYDGYVVNVPNPLKRFPALNENRPAWLPKHLYIADHTRYDEQRGFSSE